jgi:hypothetical protein
MVLGFPNIITGCNRSIYYDLSEEEVFLLASKIGIPSSIYAHLQNLLVDTVSKHAVGGMDEQAFHRHISKIVSIFNEGDKIMRFNVSNCVVFTPDTDGIVELRVSGDVVQKIQETIMREFMTPIPPSESCIDGKPAAGVPSDFQLIIKPLSAPDMTRISSTMRHQESTVYVLYGTKSVKEFLKDKCGVEV